MVSERSGRLQDTHSLRMWICQRRKSVGVGFMGLGVYGLEKLVFVAGIGFDFYLRTESVGPAQHILAGVTLGPNLDNLPGSIVRT